MSDQTVVKQYFYFLIRLDTFTDKILMMIYYCRVV